MSWRIFSHRAPSGAEQGADRGAVRQEESEHSCEVDERPPPVIDRKDGTVGNITVHPRIEHRLDRGRNRKGTFCRRWILVSSSRWNDEWPTRVNSNGRITRSSACRTSPCRFRPTIQPMLDPRMDCYIARPCPSLRSITGGGRSSTSQECSDSSDARRLGQRLFRLRKERDREKIRQLSSSPAQRSGSSISRCWSGDRGVVAVCKTTGSTNSGSGSHRGARRRQRRDGRDRAPVLPTSPRRPSFARAASRA